jgi:putative membrane protein
MNTTHTKTALVAALLTLGLAGMQPTVAAAAGHAGTSATSGNSPSAASSSSAASSQVAAADREFAMKAAQGGMMEVELGKLAQSNAQDEQVKSFGERMVKDHSAANDKLKQIASSHGIQLPTTPGEHQKTIDKMKSLKGAQFDTGYMTNMVSDHQKDIKEFEKEAKSGHGDLKQFASDTLPTLREHLSLAQSTKSAVMNEARGKSTEKHASNQSMTAQASTK